MISIMVLRITPWLLLLLTGCGSRADKPELLWGKAGVMPGQIHKPRAIAIDKNDRLYIVDYTARIQAFDREGQFLKIHWTPPDYRNGRPSGLGIARDGNILVCDSHYGCLRFYTPEGQLLRTLGGDMGTKPGQLNYISDVVEDAEGFFYLAEFGDNNRISKFDREGAFVKCWGAPGSQPGQFARLRALALGPDGLLYAADACNHRIQVFDRDGQWLRMFGTSGEGPGELGYPYDLAFSTKDPNILYVAEYGNQRVQKFNRDGQSLGTWGGPGREAGRLSSPWGLAVDSRGRVHVLDSENHRVQRIDF